MNVDIFLSIDLSVTKMTKQQTPFNSKLLTSIVLEIIYQEVLSSYASLQFSSQKLLRNSLETLSIPSGKFPQGSSCSSE